MFVYGEIGQVIADLSLFHVLWMTLLMKYDELSDVLAVSLLSSQAEILKPGDGRNLVE
jgi:hypothetical protein